MLGIGTDLWFPMPAALTFLAFCLADPNAGSTLASGLDFQLGDIQQLTQ